MFNLYFFSVDLSMIFYSRARWIKRLGRCLLDSVQDFSQRFPRGPAVSRLAVPEASEVHRELDILLATPWHDRRSAHGVLAEPWLMMTSGPSLQPGRTCRSDIFFWAGMECYHRVNNIIKSTLVKFYLVPSKVFDYPRGGYT